MNIPKCTGNNYKIVHVKRVKGCTAIDRTSRWGNKFPLSDAKDEKLRLECVAKYKMHLWRQMQLGNVSQLKQLIALKNQHPDKQLSLGCWCAPRLCHGDVLAAACDYYESKLSTN